MTTKRKVVVVKKPKPKKKQNKEIFANVTRKDLMNAFRNRSGS